MKSSKLENICVYKMKSFINQVLEIVLKEEKRVCWMFIDF